MIRRFFRHIREGFYGVGRHAAMSVSSASAVTITLLIISIFMIVTGNMQEVTHNIEGSVKISAFVAYDHEEQAQLDMIQATIKNLEHVVSVEYSSTVSYTHLDVYKRQCSCWAPCFWGKALPSRR